MVEDYELKHPLNLGGKVIDVVKVRRLTIGDFYNIKNMEDMGPKEICSILGAMTGLSEPEVKRLDLEDVGFLSSKAEGFMASFQ